MGEARIILERMLSVANGMCEGVILGESDANEKCICTTPKTRKRPQNSFLNLDFFICQAQSLS
jgi:hypothetical protein